MAVSVREYLTPVAASIEGLSGRAGLILPELCLEPEKVELFFLNEAAPADPADSFYSRTGQPADLLSALSLLSQAGRVFSSLEEAAAAGLYLTTALKTPKQEYVIPRADLEAQLPLLEAELALFPYLKAVMLMGDAAIKAFNLLARRQTKKAVIPAQSTYKIRDQAFFFGRIRVFPSYIMTGKNLLIEKGKIGMIVEDIQRALALLP